MNGLLDSVNCGIKKEPGMQELVLFHLVSREFVLDNIYTARGTAKVIAEQYGCQLEFREAKFKDHPCSTFFRRRENGIGDDGSCYAAVLIGDNREQLAKVRDDIHKTFGVKSFYAGTISILASHVA